MKTVVVLNKDSREALAFVESHRLAGGDATAPVQRARMTATRSGLYPDEHVVLPDPPAGADSRFIVVRADLSARDADLVFRQYLVLDESEPLWLEPAGRGGDRVELWYAAEGYAIDLRACRCYEYRAHEPLLGIPDFLFGPDVLGRVESCVRSRVGLRLASPCAGDVKPLEPLSRVAGLPNPVGSTDLYIVCNRYARIRADVTILREAGGGEVSFESWLALCLAEDGRYPSEVDAVVRRVCGLGVQDTPWFRWAAALSGPAAAGIDWRAARRRMSALVAEADASVRWGER